MELEFDIDGFKLQAKTWGRKGDSPILAIHGWLDNANTFDAIAPLISTDKYIVAIDLAGHGISDHRSSNSSYYLWDYAIDLLNVVTQLKWKKFSILAHSMGTGIAAIIAGSMPHLIDSLVFVDGLGAPFVVKEEDIVSNFHKSVRQLDMAKKTKLHGFSSPETVQFITKADAIKDRTNNSIGEISDKAAGYLVSRSLKEISGGYRWTYDPRIVLSECYKMTEAQVALFIRAIGCETLIILGKQGLFAKGMFNSRIEKFKNSQVHWVAGGHHLHLETEYQKISTLINQFLKLK